MKQNIKLHLQHYYTKRDMYGNVYHAVRVVNIKNGKGFLISTPSLGNVTGILHDAFKGWQNCQYIISEVPTNSVRLSSLPAGRIENLNPCGFDDCKPYKGSWKRELNKIGFKLPRKAKK